MNIALSGEGELGVVVIEQSELLHVKSESNEIAEKLLLVGQFDEKLRCYIETFEVLSPIVCEK